MCLYPKLIRNRKYLPNKKNGGNPPLCKDERTLYVPVGCGKCIECLTQKSRAWNVRLQEEIRTDKTAIFVSLTLSNQSYKELDQEIENLSGYERDNEIAKLAVRRFLERWRKKHGTSVKHWLVTECGHQGTENIHLHGLIFTDKRQDIETIWKYGFVYLGSYTNEKTLNYIMKYITKVDVQHKYFTPRIFTSAGIGKNYTRRPDAETNKFNDKQTREYYTTRQGIKLNLPIYYRNKLYNEDEREKLWLNKLDQQIRWIRGIKVDISKSEDRYYGLLKHYQQQNIRLGYGSDKINWERKKYEQERRNLKRLQRISAENLETSNIYT